MLLNWYRRHRRKLPWRSDPTPYRVWIAEIMLQQTRVTAALPFYERFLKRFPDVGTLAAATEKEVLAAWAGLGYYSRARNLWRAAGRMEREFGGRVPGDLEALRTLPGIGRYTAGAICSIAFNQPQPIVDGNVRRVLSRLHGIEHRSPEQFFWEQAGKLVPAGRASDFNQALMELGALVCLPAKPLCPSCPARSLCAARANGTENRIPSARSARVSQIVELVVLTIEHEGKVLVTMRNAAEFIPGKWCLPTRVIAEGRSPLRAARSLAREIVRKPVPVRPTSLIRHSITWRRIVAHVFCVDPGEMPAPRPYAWAKPSKIEQLLTSSLYRKALRKAGLQK